jgi:FtsP/CotA-like multicopper oxidase with cupredoxin domain
MTRIQSNTCSAVLIRYFPLLVAAAILLLPGHAHALINGVTGTSFSLTASAGYISVADGASVYSWGYSTGSTMQLPGPTLIVTQGDTVTVTLTNSLPAAVGNVSIVFPGHQVSATGGVPGPLTQEAPPGGSVTYTFMANQPGTYQYHSGSQPDLQVEMGLYGALIVRPAAPATGCVASAYNNSSTCYDREYLYLLSEVDLDVHRAAERQAGGPGPIMLPPGEFHS